MKVLRNLVLITNKAPDGQKHGPIITMESSHNSGTIVDVGPDVKDLKPGQRVYYLNRSSQVSIKNESFLVMEDDNIFAVEE